VSDKLKGIEVHAKDISATGKIEAHLQLLAQLNTALHCTLDPQRFLLKVGGFSSAGDRLDLLALADFPPLHEDEILTVHYFFQGEPYRFGQRVVAVDAHKGVIHTHFPLIIRHNERRRSPRYNFSQREETNTVILTDLVKGIGISGPMHNLGRFGGALLIRRMVSLASEKDIRVAKPAVPLGPFALVRFHLAIGGDIETGGLNIHVLSDGQNLRLGFAFQNLSKEQERALESFLRSKLG
jgi:hypothetical protein